MAKVSSSKKSTRARPKFEEAATSIRAPTVVLKDTKYDSIVLPFEDLENGKHMAVYLTPEQIEQRNQEQAEKRLKQLEEAQAKKVQHGF